MTTSLAVPHSRTGRTSIAARLSLPSLPSHASRPSRSAAPGRPLLPAPQRRREIREAWGLTRPQVAAAFGVTVDTVRSWESGRTSPKGPRLRAYATFLTGLDQALSAYEPTTAPSPTPSPAPPTAPRTRPVDHAVLLSAAPAAAPAPAPVRAVRPDRITAPALPAPVAALPVRPLRADPVSALRRRRLRTAALAAAVWALFLYVLHTAHLS
ncbi:helix-turn-helix domain-containing protein [Streptomyces hypolithicus]